MKMEKSCGAVVSRMTENGREILLIRHMNGGHWAFPKGHVEKDETEEQTARREILEETGLIAMIGKAERGPTAIEAIRDNQSAYLMAVGGAAYLVAKAIKNAKVVGFEDLGMEAIYEFDVQDMPVTVAVDAQGTSVHETGPREWAARIAGIPVVPL